MKQTTEPFEELMIPRRDLSISSVVVYRIYTDSNNFELIEASSAIDALANSKVKNVFKVMRHDPLGENVIQWNQVVNDINASESTILQKEEISSVVTDVAGDVEDSVSVVVDSQSVPEEVQVQPEIVGSESIEEVKPAAEQIAEVESTALSNEDVDKLLNG